MVSARSFISVASVLAGLSRGVVGYDNSKSDNLAVYWGQNSYGATHPDEANWQQSLAHYCQDDSIDAIPLAFMNVFFGAGGLPSIDLSNICSVNTGVFPGSQLPDCSKLATDIKTCQAKGKIVTLSLGGATGANAFTDDNQAKGFADQLWNLFFGGTSDTRPFGDASLDGIDLDIEGGSTAHYEAFLAQLQSHFKGGNKQYYTTAAPQCPFPDAYLGTLLNAAHFDAVYVQFYNNYCSLPNYANSQDWDYASWDTWATTQSPNKDVKIFIGAPASETAANAGMFVDAGTLGKIATETRSSSKSFGGVMLWDASQAYANGRYDAAVKQALKGSGKLPSHKVITPAATNGTANCASAARWVGNVNYDENDTAVHAGHVWSAKYWNYGSAPGSKENDWNDEGACGSSVGTEGFKYQQKSVPTTVPDSVPTSAAKNAKRSRVYRR